MVGGQVQATVNFPEMPDSIWISADATAIELSLEIGEAVGVDLDGSIKPIDDLSYKPQDGWGRKIPSRLPMWTQQPASLRV